MGFEIKIVSNTPLVGEIDPNIVAKIFFEQIGYISKGADPKIPYKIFADFFIRNPSKAWFVEEISNQLKTSKPTIYRHLNKLKGLDILEEMQIFDEISKQNKKAYRLRYANLEKAWNFVEAHIKVAVENYGKTVEHLQKLMDDQKKV
ncbi:MAG: transcriptional regulator [Candidatus Thermoplasmatota archaeon]|jgi:predicted transcriptional regulator|nr:transcriptional regulator [Candidatus Thermoplasmatota archaeon]